MRISREETYLRLGISALHLGMVDLENGQSRSMLPGDHPWRAEVNEVLAGMKANVDSLMVAIRKIQAMQSSGEYERIQTAVLDRSIARCSQRGK
jgi:hypothetical protein